MGQGDTLELSLSADSDEADANFEDRLRQAFPAATVTPEGLVLRQLAVIDALPAIVDQVKQLGASITRLQLRESTLEDVFIALTGRRLRE